MPQSRTEISVIVPTIGRPELSEALDSIRRQDGVSSEIVLVADLASDSPEASRIREIAEDTRLLFTGGGMGAAYGRNLGIQEARSEWVAFLDDDDLFTENKLALTLQAAQQHGASVVGSRVHQVQGRSTRRIAEAVPVALLAPHQDPAHYLFRKRRPGAGRASLFTSTLAVKRSLALEVPWDSTLRRHQDWDWIIRLATRPEYRFHHLPEALSVIRVGSEASISAGSDWEASLHWAGRTLSRHDAGVYVDFLAAQTLRYALQARSAAGVKNVLAAVYRARRIPSPGPLLIGSVGVLGRRGVERAMASFR